MPAKPCAQLRSVEGIQYELVRKKVKQLHLRVRSNGTVMVSIPLTASLEQADRFVLQNAQWIRDTRVKNITKLNKDNADLPSAPNGCSRPGNVPCGAQRRKRGLCRIRKQRWPILRP